MEKISTEVGDVVWVKFPYSDRRARKGRPALVLAQAPYDDLVVCQITSKVHRDKFAMRISADDFQHGNLERVSYIRVAKLFTANKSLVQDWAGKLKPATMQRVRQSLAHLFKVPMKVQ